MASSRTLLERIGDLIEGKPGAADAVSDLLRTAPPADWLDASRHREPSVRAAAITAARQRNPDEVRGRLTEMLNDASESVSAACLAAVQHAPDLVTDDGALLTFLERIGDDAAPVVRRLGHRSKFTVRLLAWLEADDYPLEDAAAAALRDALSRAVVLELARILVARSYSDATVLGLLDHHVGLDLAALEPESLADEQRISIARKLSDHPATRFVQLRSALDVVTRGIVDGSVLKEFGRILSDDYRHGELTKGFLLEDSVQRVLARIDSESGSRCALVLGKPGTGKTTLVHAVTAGLAERGWTVVEVIPSEIMVGTKFLGEWETRVQRLIDAARSPRRVVLVMPSVQHLLDVGKSTARDTSASSMLMPLMERGELVVIGEADKDAFAKAAASSPAFRRVFAAFEMMPATIEVTRKLVSLVAQDRSISLPRELVEEIIHLAEGFVTTAEQPGRTLGLLRRALAACPGQPTVRDLLELLSESTGAPVDFLDHSVALDLNETRRFFETRVIGQPDAITAVLDTVTLIKAGLTDPHRPNSVLLFVGPTGVGKTELARALAKFLFGDEGRLLRFDMSEFASYESYERLIGAKNLTGGLLTDAVTRSRSQWCSSMNSRRPMRTCSTFFYRYSMQDDLPMVEAPPLISATR